MKKYIQLTVAVCSILFLFSCQKEKIKPSSEITSEVYEIADFDRIDVKDAIDVDITFTTTGDEQVVVEANSNIHHYIITEVVNGTLYIHRKKNVRLRGDAHIRVHILVDSLSAADISDASHIQLNSSWYSEGIDLKLSGASNISGEINTNSLSLHASGASVVSLTGTSGYSYIKLSGASSLENLMFATDVLNATLSGASNATLTVHESLSLILSGASTLRYAGDGSIDHIESSGASSVKRLD